MPTHVGFVHLHRHSLEKLKVVVREIAGSHRE